MVLGVFTLTPLCVYAEESGVTGDCTWTLSNTGALTISGNGEMGTYNNLNNLSPWGTNMPPATTSATGSIERTSAPSAPCRNTPGP